MQASAACISLIKAFESCELTAYQDEAGVWTIGWGHTLGVTPGRTLTQEEADQLLVRDVAVAEAAVDHLTRTLGLTQPEFDALVSFTFNVGVRAFAESTLLQKLEAGDTAGAAAELLRWDKVHVGGQAVESPGLLRRRRAERALFLG